MSDLTKTVEDPEITPEFWEQDLVIIVVLIVGGSWWGVKQTSFWIAMELYNVWYGKCIYQRVHVSYLVTIHVNHWEMQMV